MAGVNLLDETQFLTKINKPDVGRGAVSFIVPSGFDNEYLAVMCRGEDSFEGQLSQLVDMFVDDETKNPGIALQC